LKFEIPQLSVADYARSLQADGARVVEKDGLWWREVRPFFFRPIVPFSRLAPRRAPSVRAVVGGYQYVTLDETEANSAVDFLMFKEADRYSIESLNSKRRWQVRAAAKHFVVRPIEQSGELATMGYPVYLSFFERTKYSYLASRVRREKFEAWTKCLFQLQGVLVLGAYEAEKLAAVSISRLIGDTLMYSTFFGHSDALRFNVASLMLHELRDASAATAGVKSVFVGMRKTGAARSIDEFYFERGAVVERLPARLRVSVLSRLVLRSFRPDLYRQLTGGGE
jgi:hypothetical protein